MESELEKQLSALTLENDDFISREVMAELDQRLTAHRADATGSITFEQFKNRDFGIV